MEAVLDVYQTADSPDIPVICIDEATKQLVGETQPPLAAQPGQPGRIDYEYERNGTANLFMVCEPMVGWRRVEVTQQRTALDYAHLLKAIVDTDYPQADKLMVIQDNLNTHSPASLYRTHLRSFGISVKVISDVYFYSNHGLFQQLNGCRMGASRTLIARDLAPQTTDSTARMELSRDYRRHPLPPQERL